MKLRHMLASLSRVLPVSNPSCEIAVESASVMQRRLSFKGIGGLKHFTTVARGGDTVAQEEFATTKTSVWWDIENCGVPRGCDGQKIAKNLELALREKNYSGSLTIYAYGDTNQISSAVQKALYSTGISLKPVPSGKKNGSDKKIIDHMMLWSKENKAPANIMLISGDGDFADVLNKLRRKNYNILLVRPEKASSALLVSVAKTISLWTNIAAADSSSEDPTLVQPSKKRKMLCEICNVTCTSSVDFNSHISSKKHKKKVLATKELRSVAMPNQKAWFCTICQASVPKGCCEAHISGRRHKNKLKSSNWCFLLMIFLSS